MEEHILIAVEPQPSQLLVENLNHQDWDRDQNQEEKADIRIPIQDQHGGTYFDSN